MSSRRAYLLAGALGLVVFLLAYGPTYALGRGPYWEQPEGDMRSIVTLVRYYVHEPWGWPLFEVRTPTVPYARSIALGDPIPLFALVSKVIASVIPPWEAFSAKAYVAMWHLITYVLQPILAVRCVRALGHVSVRSTALAALYFLAVPTWIYREGHPPLAAHFVLLWGLALYLEQARAEHVALLATVTFINPYLTVMSLAIFFASVVRARRPLVIARWLGAGLGVIVACALFAGLIGGERLPRTGGFDLYSMNALSPFLPRGGIFGDWRSMTEARPEQYEGYAYLGAGKLLLLAFFVPRWRLVVALARRHKALMAVVVALTIVCLSTRVFVGRHQLFSYSLYALDPLLGVFRSSGRFCWVPTYGLTLFLFHWASSLRGRGAYALPAAIALQLVELVAPGGHWADIHAKVRVHFPFRIAAPEWRALVRAHDAVEIYPRSECIDSDRVARQTSMEVGFLASERTLPINGVPFSRTGGDCGEDGKRYATRGPDEGTLYVLLLARANGYTRFEASGASCASFAEGVVCSRRVRPLESPAFAPIDRAQRPGLTLAIAQRIVAREPRDARFFAGGWSENEGRARWTQGPTATVLAHVEGDIPEAVSLRLEASALVCKDRTTQTVDVLIDDAPIGVLTFTPSDNHAVRTLPIPDPSVLRRPAFRLELRARDLRSPAQLECGDDPRPLGLSLERLWFE